MVALTNPTRSLVATTDMATDRWEMEKHDIRSSTNQILSLTLANGLGLWEKSAIVWCKLWN